MSDEIKRLVERLRKPWGGKILLPWMAEYQAMAAEAADALEDLAEWRRQALALEATWDVQAVGRLIKVPLGGNILPAIQPALEAMEGEVERLKDLLGFKVNLTEEMVQLNKERVAAEAERDRLKAAVKEIADMLNRGPDSSQNWDVKSIYDIARKAQEAKE